jgi:DNA-binding MarR family transcriptional regulator
MIAQAIDNPAMSSSPRPPARPRFYDGRRYVAGDSVGYLLNQVVLSMRRTIEQRMSVHGLTAAQWYPLWRLKLGHAGTARELARDSDIDAGAMTRLIDRLVQKGLVERSRSVTDRRALVLRLTPAGEAVAAELPKVLAQVNNDYLRGFDSDEWQRLQALLRCMLDNGRVLGEPEAARKAAARGGRR